MTSQFRPNIVLTLAALVGLTLLANSANAQLVAHWPMTDGPNGGAATTADDVIDDGSHGATDGSGLSGATWVFDATRNRTVLEKDDFDRLAAGTQDIDLNTNGFSWHMWVEIDSTNNGDAGADVIMGSRSGIWNKLQPTGWARWFDVSGYDVADDTWHHMAVVGTTEPRGILYIDGVPVNAGDPTPFGGTLVNNNPLELGGASLFNEDTSGRYSDMAIWDEDLTADEVVGLFDVGDHNNDLLYDAGQFDLLKQVHDAGSGSVTIDGLTWEFASGLADPAGLTLGPTAYNLVLNAGANTGLSAILPTPEPSAVGLSIVGLMSLSFVGWRRRRR